MRTDWVFREEMQHILAAMMPENRLACEISLATGLRIGDVLALPAEKVLASPDGRITVKEQKTGKSRSVRIPKELHQRACRFAGKRYVFEGRLDWRKSRTRQAVYKDLKQTAAVFKVRHHLRENIAPHSARKVFAVEAYRRTGDLKKVQALLNHSSEAVTQIYALADLLTERRLHGGRPQKSAPKEGA